MRNVRGKPRATLRITIDIFSGRPNPVIELTGRQAREALALLKSAGRERERDLPPVPTLGYRGLLIERPGTRQRQPVRTIYPALEDFVTQSALMRKLALGREFPSLLRREMDRFRELCERWPSRRHRWPVRHRCRCAPLCEPTWWNDGGQKQLHNNCYNYASNYRTDTFRVLPDGSQPGAAAGAMYTQLTCASVGPAAVADGLIASPGVNNRCPNEGHLVALVIAPGIDFHRYRKGRNGYWSHKPGSTPVVNVDNSNNLIPDPRSANRGMYTQFCTFMVVMHRHQDSMRRTRCTGTAFVYSGRVDPQWPITAKQLQTLTKMWKELPPSRIPPPSAPPLGYRGCAVRCASGEEWFVFDGVASLTRRAHRPEYRLDEERQFERSVLETAPPGAIPESFPDCGEQSS